MKHKILMTTAIFLMIGLTTQIAFAQQPSTPSPEMVAANKLVQDKKWKEAENAFDKIVKSEPKNARAWFMLGLSKHSQGKWKEAIEAFKKNVELANAPFGMYNVAAGYSQLNKKDEAFEWLEKALTNGAAFGSNISADADFANIKGDTRFKKMLEIVDQQINPCMYSAEARQFDFWIGDWDVFVQGRKVGENLVEREVNGCILVENWKNTGGGTGKSINVYNAVRKKWKQFYVGSQGAVLEFEGEYKDKILHMTSETIDTAGAKTMHILEFRDLPDKTVRQLWKQSTDNGKTWNTVWDSIYKRKES
jgi:tetratricopeptide (TPR) repeat protein